MPAFRFLDLLRQAGAPRDPNPGFARLYVDADGVPRVRDGGEDSALAAGSSTASAVTLDPSVAGQTNVQDALAAVAGGGGLLKVVSVTLTDDEIKASAGSETTELFAPPGAGIIWLPLGGYAVSNIVTPYTNQDTLKEIVVGWDDDNEDATSPIFYVAAGASSVFLGMSSFVYLYPSMFQTVQTNGGASARFSPTAITNVNLALYVDNDGNGDFTGGDPANTLTIVLYYVEIVLP